MMRAGAERAQQRQQAHGQQEAREVVDREAQLVAVLAHLALPPVGEPRADAGVADQHVQLRGSSARTLRARSRTSSSDERSARKAGAGTPPRLSERATG